MFRGSCDEEYSTSRHSLTALFSRTVKQEGFRWTGSHTRRYAGRQVFLADAQIALLHLIVGAELGHVIGTSIKTSPTPRASLLIDNYDPILNPFLDSSRTASFHTGRLGAVHTSNRDRVTFDLGVRTIPDIIDPSPFHPRLYISPAFTGQFAGMALDTTLFTKRNGVLPGHDPILLPRHFLPVPVFGCSWR